MREQNWNIGGESSVRVAGDLAVLAASAIVLVGVAGAFWQIVKRTWGR